MKKIITSTILLSCLFTISNAQTQKIVSASEYDALKASGQIKQYENYYFSDKNNSTVAIAKIYPPVQQIDTAGSTCSCMVPIDTSFSIVPMYGYAPPFYRNDDGYSNLITIPFNFNMYGTSYNTLYINNNGNISFDAPYSAFTSSGFPDPSYKMIAPYWADVDTRDMLSGLVYYKITNDYMIVKWSNVGYYNSHSDKVSDFQLIISNGTDSLLPGSNNVAFCYGDMGWTTGDASQGTNGFGGIPSTVGVNQGNGINYAQITRNDSSGSAYDGPNGSNDGVDWLDYKSFYFDLSDTAGISPIAYDSICDTTIVIADSLSNPFRLYLNAMDSGDSITFSYQNLPVGMFPSVNRLGNTTEISFRYYPVQTGLQMLSLTYNDYKGKAGMTYQYKKYFDVQSVSTAVGINNPNSEWINLYPNPAGNQLIINTSKNISHKVYLMDILGKKQLLTVSSVKSDIIDISDIKKGVYTLLVEYGQGETLAKKLIIE